MIKKYQEIIVAVLLIGIFSLFVHALLAEKIPDPDGFYHLRHAWIYRTAGLFNSSFPWAQYSVINKYSADLWYGFHILIIPFTYFQDLLQGLRITPWFITVASLLMVFAALKRLKVRWPLFWVFFFAIASADVLFRLTMLRPHPLSLGLALLLFAYLSPYGGSSEGRQKTDGPLVAVFLISAVSSWIHLSLSWLPLLVVFAVTLLEALNKQGLDWKKPPAVFAGLLAGLLLRPNPLGAAKLAYIQVVQLLLEKQKDLPLRFGRELSPFVWDNFVDQLIPITVLLLIALGIFLWWRKLPKTEVRISTWGTLILSVIFAALAFGVARRSNEVFIGFGVIFLALVFTNYFPALQKKSWQHNLIVMIFISALIYMPIKNIYRFETYLGNSFGTSEFKDLSEWLSKNSKPGEIVFNIHWDRFAQLFFYNYNNYYINGMDPIFQYAFNPSLYWKTHFFAIDAATAFTCGQIRCTAKEVETTPKVLKNDFRASYIVVEKRRSPKFYQYLDITPEFRKVFENDEEALYKIL